MKILLTNDDSHSSPLLAFIIERLESVGEVTIVVPKHEQSWKGKALSRFEKLHLEEAVVQGRKGFTVDGTPADCVNLGVHHLFDGMPSLIVSGINAGLNAGLGFILSSGTVGACIEGNIAGVPALAFSQAFDTETRNRYLLDYTISEATFARLGQQTRTLLDQAMSIVLGDDRFLRHAVTWNFNFPFLLREGGGIVPRRVGFSWYGSCFKRGEVAFAHELRDIRYDSREEVDTGALFEGLATVTPLDVRSLGQLVEPEFAEMAAAFDRSPL